MICAVNYADAKFKKAQTYNTRTAHKCGIEQVFSFGPEDIDPDFARENAKILAVPRGNGYWLWKPYFINRVLESAVDGDWVCYSDAGMFWLRSPENYITQLEAKGIELACLAGDNIEKCYTKRDAFVLMGLDEPKYADTLQSQGGILLCRKTEWTMRFIRKWLEYCRDERILTDQPNTCGLGNYPEFIDHRHDQSVLSLLVKKYNVYTDILMVEFEKRKKSDALLCYHHSSGGNLLEIRYIKYIRPVWWALKTWLRELLKHCHIIK